MRESLAALGATATASDVRWLEVGFDPAEKVKQYLASFDTGSLKVTFDPVNFMLHGHDPLASLTPACGVG